MRWKNWMIMLAPALLAACATGGGIADEAATVRELKAIADAWDQAIVGRDTARIAANMAEDFRQVRGSGAVVEKAKFVEDITRPGLSISPYVVEDFSVRVFGDVALLYGRVRMQGTADGQPFSEHFRYIDVYARRNGRWQVVSVQITPMPAAAG